MNTARQWLAERADERDTGHKKRVRMQPPFGVQDAASPGEHHQSGTPGPGAGVRKIRVLCRIAH